jgi:ABC-type amino acid transport substrate-binding protein
MNRTPRHWPALAIGLICVLSASSARPIDLPEIRQRGTLRVLVSDGAPQFFSWQPGVPPGFDREIIEGFARLNRLDLAIVPVTSWAALGPALDANKGDLIAGGVSSTETLARVAQFSVEVFPSRHVVVTRRPHPVVHTLAELQGERVGTVKGSSMAEVLAALELPAGQVDESIPHGGLVAALKAGTVTACVMGMETAILAQRSDPGLQIGMSLGPRRSLAFGVRKDNVKLREGLNEYLGNLRRTPTWNRLVLTYFGDGAAEILRAARAE